MKKIKQLISALLVTALVLTSVMIPSTDVTAGELPYKGKTVIIYTGNVRGDVDVYSQIAQVKKQYQEKGAEKVLLVDTGNYLQGKTYANSDRGQGVVALMTAAGYDYAGVGLYDLCYGDATTGVKWHGNLFKYYTQKELMSGAELLTYAKSGKGDVTETRAAIDSAGFKALSYNFDFSDSEYYTAEKLIDAGDVTITAITDPTVNNRLQDGLIDNSKITADYTVALNDDLEQAKKSGDITVCLSNGETAGVNADVIIGAPTDGQMVCGAYVVDGDEKTVISESVQLNGDNKDASVEEQVSSVKEAAKAVVGVSTVTLDGAIHSNRNMETNLGDLVTDALKWYVESGKVDGADTSLPVVAIQNGGNCVDYMYSGDITETDLLRSFPYSPMGIGVMKVTGAQLVEIIEAGAQPATSAYGGTNAKPACPGFAQVSGLTYSVETYREFDAGEPYGKFNRANSVQRVTVTSVGEKTFDAKATYLLVTDNFLMNGNDTYYLLKEIKQQNPSAYISNGNGVLTRDIVKKYIAESLNGNIDSVYELPQGRINMVNAPDYKVLAGADAVWNKGTTTDLSLRVSARQSDVKEVQLNGQKVDPANYTLSDNTVITMKAGYLNSLNAGGYVIKVVLKYGEVNTKVTIVNAVEPKPTNKTIKKGDIVQPVKNTKKPEAATYKVTDTKKKTVTYKASKTKSKTAVVPSTIKVNGKTYKVTAIADNAFKNNKKLTKITVGKNVAKIGKNAFYGTKKVSKITVNGNSLKSVGKNAFKNVKKNCKISIQAKSKKQYNKVIKMIKKSGAKKVKFAYQKKK